MELTEYDRDFIARSIKNGYTTGEINVCDRWVMWELTFEEIDGLEEDEEENNN